MSTSTTTIITHSEAETIQEGIRFADGLRPRDVVACYGPLGAGKTRFIKGICKGLGVSGNVTSPTFTILTEYSGTSMRVYHFDFYRLASLRELQEIGFEEYLGADGVSLIEWAEHVAPVLPLQRIDVRIDFGDTSSTRVITIDRREKVAA